jgi:Bbp16
MILDGYLLFTNFAGGGTGVGDTPTVGSQVSTNQLDLGIIGLPTSAGGGGARDIGIGDDPAMKLLVLVTTAFASGTSLQVNVQGAPDNGAGAPGAFVIMASGPVVAEANLIVGARLLDIDMPRPAPAQPLPRFLQLGYVSVGTHTAGAVKGFLVLDRHDLPEQSNAVLGGYPAGITIPN